MIDPAGGFLKAWDIIPFVPEYAVDDGTSLELGVDELYELARYWAKAGLEIVWFHHVYAVPSSDEIRRVHLAEQRLTQIAKLLGDSLVGSAIRDVEDWRGMIDQRLWEINSLGEPPLWHIAKERYLALVSSVYDDSWSARYKDPHQFGSEE